MQGGWSWSPRRVCTTSLCCCWTSTACTPPSSRSTTSASPLSASQRTAACLICLQQVLLLRTWHCCHESSDSLCSAAARYAGLTLSLSQGLGLKESSRFSSCSSNVSGSRSMRQPQTRNELLNTSEPKACCPIVTLPETWHSCHRQSLTLFVITAVQASSAPCGVCCDQILAPPAWTPFNG